MADIKLTGPVMLRGNLSFSGGKLLVGGKQALVVVTGGDSPQCNGAPPVLLPPPPASPAFPQPTVWIISSFNQTVKVNNKAIVALGMVMQGQAGAPWPGMMLPGSGPAMINGIPINVVGDQAVIFPSGGSASFNLSGQ